MTVPALSVPAIGTGDRLASEAEGLLALLSAKTLIALALVALVAWVVAQLTSRAVRMAWRYGLDPTRRLALLESGGRLLAAIIVMYVVLHRSAAVAPLLTVLAGIVLLGAAALGLASDIRRSWQGADLAARGGVRVGTRITVGDVTGVVEKLTPSRAHLLRSDGSRVLLPLGSLTQDAIAVERVGATVRVTVESAVEVAPSGELLERLRAAAALSAYRAEGTEVAVEVELGSPIAVRVRLHTWNDAAAPVARRHLQRLARELLHDEGQSQR